MGGVDGDAADVGGARGSRQQHRVRGLLKGGVPIREVDVLDDVGGIDQHHQMLCQHRGGGDSEFFLGEQDRAGFGDPQRRAHDRDVDVGGCVPTGELRRVDISAYLTSR